MDEPMSFTPAPHDIRIETKDWVYWVRAVKRGQGFRGDLAWDGSLFGLLIYLLVGWLYERWLRTRKTWKVGVVAYPNRSFGGRLRLVRKETLLPDVDFRPRLEELAAMVRNGEIRASGGISSS